MAIDKKEKRESEFEAGGRQANQTGWSIPKQEDYSDTDWNGAVFQLYC